MPSPNQLNIRRIQRHLSIIFSQEPVQSFLNSKVRELEGKSQSQLEDVYVTGLNEYMSNRIVSPSLHFIRRLPRSCSGQTNLRPLYLPITIARTYSSRDYQYTLNIPQRVGKSSSTLTLVIAAWFLVAGSVFFGRKSRILEGTKVQISPTTIVGVALDNVMVGSVLPGRPGNLTADQEAKLQELWTATLTVFGVQGADTENRQSGPGIATSDSTPSKKKQSIFRKQKDQDDNKTSGDQNDKYGQSKAFQQVLATQNPESLRKAFWSMVKHDNPDGLLLRFLRARKWDVHNALVMMIATMNWRMHEVHVDDDIMKKGEAQAMQANSSGNATVKKEAQDFLAQMRLGKSFLHGTDKEGRPMCFVRVRLHKQGEQSETSLERYTVYTIETARLLLASHVDTAVRNDEKCWDLPLMNP